MKKATSKIILLVLSLALLVGSAIGISVSANTTAPDIISKNVKTNGNFCLQFAVDPTTVIGDDVTLTIYNQDPTGLEGDALTEATVQTITKAKTDTEFVALDGDKVQDDEVIVFDSKGVAAKDIADVWYIKTASGGVESAIETYSVREYAFERLYKDGTIFAKETDDDDYKYRQQQFYLGLLEMGSVAQELQVNYKLEAAGSEPEKLAKEYIYAYVDGGTYTVGEGEATDRGFVQNGDVLTLTASDSSTTGWNVYTYLQGGTLSTTQVVALGDTVTVTGNTVILPYVAGVTPGLYYNEANATVTAPYTFTGLTYKNLQGNQGTTHIAYLGHTNYSITNTGYAFYETGDEQRGTVFKVSKTDAASAQSLVHFPVYDTKENANCFVFEFDFMYTGANHKFTSTTVDSNGELSTSVFFMGVFSDGLDKIGTWTAMESARQFSTALISKDYDGVVDDSLIGGDAFRIESVSDKQYDLVPNTWYNICYEIYPEKNMCVIYVDGIRVGAWSPSTFTIANGDINNINRVSLMMDYRLNNYEMMFDDVYAGKIVKEYVAP